MQNKALAWETAFPPELPPFPDCACRLLEIRASTAKVFKQLMKMFQGQKIFCAYLQTAHL
jgi:hypothetical protein